MKNHVVIVKNKTRETKLNLHHTVYSKEFLDFHIKIVMKFLMSQINHKIAPAQKNTLTQPQDNGAEPVIIVQGLRLVRNCQ